MRLLIFSIAVFFFGFCTSQFQLPPYELIKKVRYSLSSDFVPNNETYNNYLSDIEETTCENIAFVGDSIVRNGVWSNGYGVSNKGIPGDTVQGVSKRLTRKSHCEPDFVFVLVGMNDILRGRGIDEIVSDYLYMVVSNPNITPLLIPSVEDEGLNARITKFNGELSRELNVLGIDHINLDEIYKNSTVDGIHPKPSVYKHWALGVMKWLDGNIPSYAIKGNG